MNRQKLRAGVAALALGIGLLAPGIASAYCCHVKCTKDPWNVHQVPWVNTFWGCQNTKACQAWNLGSLFVVTYDVCPR